MIRRNNHNQSSSKRVLLFLLMLIFLVFLAGITIWNYLISPAGDEAEKRVFTISQGESTGNIAQKLEDEGFIKSALAFKVLVKLESMAGKIQAGVFELAPTMSSRDILKQFSMSITDSKRVTLVEGWRLEEMAGKLSAELGVNEEEFITQAREGHMFPDTYQFENKATLEEIIVRLKENFDKKYNLELQEKIERQGLTAEEGVILASIVEREGRSPEVKKMIASILLKRLNVGMGLNADATVQYALGYQAGEKSWWKRHLSHEDLKIDSSYNTYIHQGLPPAPICSPGIASLIAVAEADPSAPYLYYYHDLEGNSYYGRTLEEHNENVANNP